LPFQACLEEQFPIIGIAGKHAAEKPWSKFFGFLQKTAKWGDEYVVDIAAGGNWRFITYAGLSGRPEKWSFMRLPGQFSQFSLQGTDASELISIDSAAELFLINQLRR
jgi:hypothetical protein